MLFRSATALAFTGSASIDTKASKVTLLFEPNAVKGVAVQVTYDKASRSFDCAIVTGSPQ